MKKKIILLAVAMSLILSSTACSVINSNQLGYEPTYTSSTEKNTFEIAEEIEEYYIYSVEHLSSDVYVYFEGDCCNVSLDLAEYVSDEKYFYYPFAKQCIKASKTMAKKYDIKEMSIDITFCFDSNSNTIIKWNTDDFGATGRLTELNDSRHDANIIMSLDGIEKRFATE